MTETPQIAQIAKITSDWRHFVQSFCTLGATDEHLAELFSVSPEIIAGWVADIPEFAKAVRRGRNMIDVEVVNSLHRLGVGYTHMAEKTLMGPNGPLVVSYTKHHRPNVRAGIAWLENRCPDEWGRAAIKRKLQAWEYERDAAACRPPFLSAPTLGALIAAREEESRALDQGSAVDLVDAGERQLVDEPYGAGMGMCRTVVERVAAQGVLGWFGAGLQHDEGVPDGDCAAETAERRKPLQAR